MIGIIGICSLLFIATALYSAWLESLQKSYEPDWTWATVVGGNTIIGLAYLACQLVMPLSGANAFWLLFLLNVVGGTPVVLWQLWQRHQRAQAREEHIRGTTPPRSSRVD